MPYPGSPGGGTFEDGRRIDYVFYSKGAANLTLTSAQVMDTRDATGVRPSDHHPLLVVFAVK